MASPDITKDPRMDQAFPTLSDAYIEALSQFGKPSHFKKGETVWEAGEPDMCMYVVVDGDMDILDGRTGEHIATHHKGSFSGDVDILSGRPTMVSSRAATDMDVLQVAADCVRSIVGEWPELGEILLRAFLLRRALLVESLTTGPLVVGSRYSPDTLRIREFLTRNHYPVVWEDLEQNADTTRLLKDFHVTEDQTPVVILPNGTLLRVPSNAELAEALGIMRPVESKLYDLVIIGAGPAGLAAAVYGASEGLETLVVDSTGPGGQAGTSSRIENYMGFPLGITGQQLADGALIQAEKFGARMIVPAEVVDITCNPLGGHEVLIEGMEKIACKCVILSPGASYRKLEIDEIVDFEGRGIFYSATQVERILCGESCVAVVGAGNSAGQAAVFMSQSVEHVFLVVRGDDLRKTMSSYLARRIEQSPKITVLLNAEICELHGVDHLEAATIVDRKTKECRTETLSGIFVMIGAIPHTDWLPPQIAKDSKGFILTGDQVSKAGKWTQSRRPYFLETSCPGVFAAGDARSMSVKRVASAVGEGSMAVAFIHQYLSL